jgi:hypothetical protein
MSDDDVLSPFLRAKHAWEQGDTDEATRILNAILARDGAQALWFPRTTVELLAPTTFEILVAALLSSDDHLLVPFPDAVTKLWNALPAQYAIRALEQRQADASDVDEAALEVVYQAASDGLLSDRDEDYERLGVVVLRSEDQPHLADIVDRPRLDDLLRDARKRRSREAFALAHPEVIANLLLYGAFHRTRTLYPELVVGTLARYAESDPDLVDLTARTLSAWVDGRPDANEIVRVGLRRADGSPACLARLADSLASREFEDFVDRCVPN